MHEATDHGRRELGPSHAAKVAECGHIDCAKLGNGCVNCTNDISTRACRAEASVAMAERPMAGAH